MSKNDLVIEATVENLDQVLAAVNELLEAAGCSMKTQMQIDVAVEEVFVNIAHYAYAPNVGKAHIEIDVMDKCPIPDEHLKGVTLRDSRDGTWLRIIFEDKGIPFNPLAKKDPDITLPAEKRQIGGLGIFMVKKSMNHVYYEYADGMNTLYVYKKLD